MVKAATRKTSKRQPAPVPASALTQQEQEVALALLDDLHDGEIAEKLKLGYETIKFYMTNIRKKLKVRTRVGIAVWAMSNLVKD